MFDIRDLEIMYVWIFINILEWVNYLWLLRIIFKVGLDRRRFYEYGFWVLRDYGKLWFVKVVLENKIVVRVEVLWSNDVKGKILNFVSIDL